MAVIRELVPPFEILELVNGESIFIKPVRFELGEIVIKPRWPGAPPEKKVLALRIHVEEGSKPYFPLYFDITSRRLVAALMPVMERAIAERMWIRITKRGTAPKAWFEHQFLKEIPLRVAPGVPTRL